MKAKEEMKNVECSSLAGIYRDIAELVGVDAAYTLYERFKGLQISFPSRFLDSEFVVKKIREEYDGGNVKELARKYGYSESRVRQLLKG